MVDGDIKKNGQVICSFEMKRKATGILFKARSEVFESWARGVSGGATRSAALDSRQVELYCGSSSWPSGDGFKMSGPIEQIYFPGGERGERGLANLRFLVMVGLAAGVEFDIPGMFSTDWMRSACEDIKTAVLRLYQSHVREVEMHVEIYMKEVLP